MTPMLADSATLSVPKPFSLKATALSHGWHECAPMGWSEGGRCFQVMDRIGHDVYRVSVLESRSAKRSVTLSLTIEGAEVTRAVVETMRERIELVLGCRQDLTGFFELCHDHPTLAVLPSIGAGRSLRSACMAENVVKALCGTNTTWTQAVKSINRIGQLGPALPELRNLNAWPTSREILRAGEKYLIEVARVGYRSSSILTFCTDVCEGRFDLEALDRMAVDDDVESDDILALLRSIHGIGPSSAHYLLSFLGRHDRLSIDTATVAHVARTHTKGRKPTARQIERIYARYGKWKNKVWWFEHWLDWSTARQMLDAVRHE